MNVKRILFSTDFSHTGDAALDLATSLARDSGATLYIVHVEEQSMLYGSGEMYYGEPDPATDDLKTMLSKVVPTDESVAYQHHMVTGTPAEAITRFAEAVDADIIVMGTHGRTGMTRALLGSVSEAVVRRAPCPVLTYKQPLEKSIKT